jgi:hypothetical protein
VSVVVLFSRPRSRLRPEEFQLLSRITGEVDSLWRGGWAEPGDLDGVVLFRDRRVIGVWSFRSTGFVYIPVTHGCPTHRASDVAQAFSLSMELLGPLHDD